MCENVAGFKTLLFMATFSCISTIFINITFPDFCMTSFYIETYGCSHNFADSEQMAGLLQQAKFTQKEKIEDADIIIFNTCTVKGPTASSFFSRLTEIKKQFPYKAIVIAGCIPQSDPEDLKKFTLVGTKQIHHIVEAVEESLNNNIVQMLETGEMPPLNLPKIRKNHLIEIIPISRGCLSACTFCKTKAARGNLQSYHLEEIIAMAKQGVQEGVKEIWLTSQDTLCYGFDIGTNIAHLLEELINLPGSFKIRIGMGNPVHLPTIKEKLFPLLNHEKVFQFLHIPLQSGNNDVLKDMRRGNTKEEFVALVREARNSIPRLTLATDIIVGYPTEKEEDFWETLNIVRETTPDIINISRFWARPKTPAAKMKQLPVEVVKHRSKVLTDIFSSIARMQNEQWIGWKGEILIDEEGKLEKQWIGRNSSYKPVLVEGNFKLGDIVPVKITTVSTFDLRGEIIKV